MANPQEGDSGQERTKCLNPRCDDGRIICAVCKGEKKVVERVEITLVRGRTQWVPGESRLDTCGQPYDFGGSYQFIPDPDGDEVREERRFLDH